MSIVAKKIMMGSGAVALPSDDEFNRTSFLSHFNGTNNGVNNQFTDGSNSNHTITANGNVTQGSFGPFARPDGEWSVGLNTDTSVSETGYLRAPSSGNFGTGNFTYEAWIYMVEGGGNPILTSNSGGVVAVFRLGTNTSYLFGHNTTTGQTTVTFSDLSATTFQWHHIALVRSSGVIKCYLNGTASSTTLSSSQTTGAAEYIGTARNFTSGGRLFDGYISNVRFSDVARYTSNFTPSTAPFVSDSNTDLLTCQNNRFVDNSSNGHTITPAGSAAVTAFGPFLTSSVYRAGTNGASGYFDYSASNYLSAADSADWDFGSDNYTVEFWMYVTSSGVYQGIFNHWGDFSGNNIAWSFEINTSNRLAFLFKTSSITAVAISSNLGDYLNQWVHVAAVRNSNVHAVYLNGVSKATTTDSGAMNNCTDVLRVGAYQADYGFDGYICDARIVKGTAVYTGNFTPPTAPLTAITNTKLLLNMADGQAVDSAAQNNLTLVADSKISTAQKKIGTSSLYVDGSGDYVTFPNTPFGTGDFTVECWVRCLGTTYDKGVWDNHTSSGSSDGLTLTRISEQQFRLFGTSELIRSGNFTITNTWVNVTVVRSSGTLNLFVNGVSQGTTTFTTNLKSSADFVIGGGRYSGGPETGSLNAYIDEFRISHMARYTSNFTPDTEPFADKGQQQ